MVAQQTQLDFESRGPALTGNPHLAFDGATFEAALDLSRLSNQLEKVKAVLLTGKWFTLGELQGLCGGSEAGCSARLRDLRKTKFGGYTVESRRRGEPKAGLFEYRLG